MTPQFIGMEGFNDEDPEWVLRTQFSREAIDVHKQIDPTRFVFPHHASYVVPMHTINMYHHMQPLAREDSAPTRNTCASRCPVRSVSTVAIGTTTTLWATSLTASGNGELEFLPKSRDRQSMNALPTQARAFSHDHSKSSPNRQEPDHFPFHLSESDTGWIQRTLTGMSIDECIGHLICPQDRKYTVDDWKELMRDIPLGCVYVAGSRTDSEMVSLLATVQEQADIPVAVVVDMVPGVGVNCSDRTIFSSSMACGAADDLDLTERTAHALALEARALGICWTLAPVADLQLNFRSPIVLARAFGDNTDKVAKHVAARVQGLQKARLLAATLKHFPGDGLDDRDQHLCTTVNPLTMAQWHATYGKVWQAGIEAGALVAMSGHINKPFWQIPDEFECPSAFPTLFAVLKVQSISSLYGPKLQFVDARNLPPRNDAFHQNIRSPEFHCLGGLE